MKDIKNLLENGVVTFTFKKANGELRTATGTRVLDSEVATGYTNEDAPKGERSEQEIFSLEELVEAQNPQAYLAAVDTLFSGCEKVVLTPNQEKRCRNGNSFSMDLADGTYRVYNKDGEFLALSKVENGTMTTIKSFFEV